MSEYSENQFHPAQRGKTPKSGEFHFEKLALTEASFTNLAEKLKEPIETGKYTVLISDEEGGRIPTLFLYKLMKKIRPDLALKPYFISAGKTYTPGEGGDNYQSFLQYLKKIKQKHPRDNYLLVTEYTFHGQTLSRLVKALNQADITDKQIGVAVLEAAFAEEIPLRISPNIPIFIGGQNYIDHISDNHDRLTGVRKDEVYSPSPISTKSSTNQYGRRPMDADITRIFGFSPDDSTQDIAAKLKDPILVAKYEEFQKAPLTEEERQAIQEDISFARRDIDLLVEKVRARVWPEDND